MKSKAERFAPGAARDAWHDTAQFFHQARQGGWRAELSEAALARFDARLDELVGPELASWWKHGSGAQAST